METGKTFETAAADLVDRGRLDLFDRRLSGSVTEALMRVDEPFREYLAEATGCHEEVSCVAGDQPGFKAALAVQGKLLQACARTSVGQGQVADMLAPSFES